MVCMVVIIQVMMQLQILVVEEVVPLDLHNITSGVVMLVVEMEDLVSSS